MINNYFINYPKSSWQIFHIGSFLSRAILYFKILMINICCIYKLGGINLSSDLLEVDCVNLDVSKTHLLRMCSIKQILERQPA